MYLIDYSQTFHLPQTDPSALQALQGSGDVHDTHSDSLGCHEPAEQVRCHKASTPQTWPAEHLLKFVLNICTDQPLRHGCTWVTRTQPHQTTTALHKNECISCTKMSQELHKRPTSCHNTRSHPFVIDTHPMIRQHNTVHNQPNTVPGL